MSKVFLYGLLIPVILSNTYAEQENVIDSSKIAQVNTQDKKNTNAEIIKDNNLSNVSINEENKNNSVAGDNQSTDIKATEVVKDNKDNNISNIPNNEQNKNAKSQAEMLTNANIASVQDASVSNVISNQLNNNDANSPEVGQNTSVLNNNEVIPQEIVQNTPSNTSNKEEIKSDVQNNQLNNEVKESTTPSKKFKRSKLKEEKLNNFEKIMNSISESMNEVKKIQEELQAQRQKDHERVTTLFDNILSKGIMVVKYPDNTSTVTTRSQVDTRNLPRSELPYDPTMVPTNIIKP